MLTDGERSAFDRIILGDATEDPKALEAHGYYLRMLGTKFEVDEFDAAAYAVADGTDMPPDEFVAKLERVSGLVKALISGESIK